MPVIYYFPGYGGGPESTTFKALQAEFPETKVILYDNRNAHNAFRQIAEQLEGSAEEVLFVGQSLGGFWAHFFGADLGHRVVLINPSLQPWISLQKYDFTEAELQTFFTLSRVETTLKKPFKVLLSKEDTVVNPAPVLEKYKDPSRFVYVDGGHQFRHYDVLFAEIRKVLETPVSS